MKVLSPSTHGYLDYLFGALLLLAPTFFDFGGTAAALCYGFGTLHIAVSLITRYPLGAIPWMSYPVHGSYELLVGALLAASPWIFGFAGVEVARNVLLVAGFGLLAVWGMTDYRRLAVDALASGSTRDEFPRSTLPFPPTRDHRDAA